MNGSTGSGGSIAECTVMMIARASQSKHECTGQFSRQHDLRLAGTKHLLNSMLSWIRLGTIHATRVFNV